MTLIVPNQGEQINLDAATGKAAATVWTLRLYSNDYTPVAGTTEAQVTEVAGGGYAAIPLTAANWTTTPGAPTSSAYAEQVFTFSGPLTGPPNVYGYYLTRADGKLIYAERLAAGFTPANNGDICKVTPVITLASVTSD